MPKQVQKFTKVTKFTSTLLTIQETTCANSVSDEWDSDDDDSDVDSPQDLTQAVFCYKMDSPQDLTQAVFCYEMDSLSLSDCCPDNEMFACYDELFAFDDGAVEQDYVLVD